MTCYKRFISLILVLILTVSSAFSVYANEGDFEIGEENYEFNLDYENDPQLYRETGGQQVSMFKSRAVSGANRITHNSKFKDAKKIYGVDVSYHNSYIDWKKVKASGIDYAILRIGYRGYGDGQIVLDKRFKENLKNARAAGLAVGVYFYTQAINNNEAKQEAEFVLKYIKGTKLELPVYYDIEEVYGASGRLDRAKLSYNAKTNLCKSFCDTIEKAGYRAGVYASYNWLTNLINGKELGKHYDIWIAHVTNATSYKNDYHMWQYSWVGNVNGIGTQVDMNVLYFIDVPSKVTELKGQQTSNKVKLSWKESLGAYGYKIYAKDLETNKITEVAQTNANSKTVEIPYSSTMFYVKAYFKVGDNYSYSSYSNGVKFNLDKVTNVSIDEETYYGTKGFQLIWSKISGASGYEILMYNKDSKKYEVLGHCNKNSFRVEKLLPATEYKFKIAAYFNSDKTSAFDPDKSKLGKFSDEFAFGTKTAKTQNLKIVSNKTNSIKIKWDKNDSRCDGYQIRVYDFTKKKYFTAGYTNNKTTQFEIKNLKAGTIYDVKVRAYYLVGKTKTPGLFSDIKSTVTVCDAPKNLKSTNLKSNQLTLNWSKTTGANGYKVYEKVGSKYELVGSTKTNSYTIKNLKKYSSHKYYIKAYKSFNQKEYLSGYSKGLTVNLAVAPKTFSVSSYGDKSVTVKWGKVSGASKYVVYKYNSSKKTYSKYKTVKSNSCTINKLKNNQSVKIAVRAVYGKVYSPYSSVKTVYTRCKKPTGFKAIALGSTYQKVSWKKVSGATNYWIYKYNANTKKYYKFKEVGNVSSTTLSGIRRNSAHKYKIYAVKKTSLKTYVSQGSSVLTAWTRR